MTRPRSRLSTILLVLAFTGIGFLMVAGSPKPSGPSSAALAAMTTEAALGGTTGSFIGPTSPPTASTAPAVTTSSGALPAGGTFSSPTPLAVTGTSLQLGIGASPTTICSQGSDNCPAGIGTARVTMTAAANEAAGLAYPAVQVAFVIETTAPDGAGSWFDGDIGSSDTCASQSGTTVECEESNGIPFFVANAQSIANEIASANPHTQVSFAMVDFFATYDDDWNDDDGAEYHVDIAQFVPAPYFGGEVRATFQQEVLDGGWYYPDNDDADNTLMSSVITAMYGTIIGSGLTWSADTHHVIVLMSSAAPQDPNYDENYCLGWESYDETGPACWGATCEPAYAFANGEQPECEGWVQAYNGNPDDSIAQLTKTAPSCTESVGGDCTVDVINLYDCSTSPGCKMWRTDAGPGSGPGGYAVLADVDKILLAGCAMAAATGGTWDGPEWFSCPDGQQGSIQEVAHGSVQNPNTQNPYLLNAFRQISFGAVLVTQAAKGTGTPVFTFVPFGNIALASNLSATASCTRDGAVFQSCQKIPSILHEGTVTFLGWNWSTNASTNVMYIGDVWEVSFNVIATGPPYAVVPIDACTVAACVAAGSGAESGFYTWATYLQADNSTLAIQSFPLAEVAVEQALSLGTSPPPPAPPPPPPPPPPQIVPAPIPTAQQVGVGQSVSVSNVSLQGVAAGVIAAGFTRISIKQRPIAQFAGKSGATPNAGSRFSSEGRDSNPAFGRIE